MAYRSQMSLRHRARARPIDIEAARGGPAPPLKGVLFSAKVWTFPFIASLFQIFTEYVRPQEKYAVIQGLPLGEVSFALLFLAALFGGRGVGTGGSAGKLILPFLVWALGASLLASNPSASLLSLIHISEPTRPY